MTLDASGRLGIGTTSPSQILEIGNGSVAGQQIRMVGSTSNAVGAEITNSIRFGAGQWQSVFNNDNFAWEVGRTKTASSFDGRFSIYSLNRVSDAESKVERLSINNSGSLLVGKTASSLATVGAEFNTAGEYYNSFTRSGGGICDFNRLTNDGELIAFWQDTTKEGDISVSGTTVSYNGGHLSRWSQLLNNSKDESILKGTVLSNLDEMNTYVDADGNAVENEQLNKVKVSDIEGDANVAGVFVNWSFDEQHNVDEINMAMTGDMIIRIAQGVTVQRGDLLMSAGDGTAKPQGDDIVRGKTIAKVTSTHVTCTYADGSYCVPCVLMAC
jgi:hypothetical protein